MNLAYRFPIIYWNCANLVTDTGGDETIEEDSSNDYKKLAMAISKMKQQNISVSLADINDSAYTFAPVVGKNKIVFGLSGISGIGKNISDIIANRPYTSFKDFLSKIKIDKTGVINLIKAGAFDEIERANAEKIGLNVRIYLMIYYLSIKNNLKSTKLTLQNLQGLISEGLIPQEYNFYQRLYYFNKYLKKFKLGDYYKLTNEAMRFYTENFEQDNLMLTDKSEVVIKQKVWDKIYTARMDVMRQWIGQPEVRQLYNIAILREEWKKYAETTNIDKEHILSAWEMESVCFYDGEHELTNIDKARYGIVDFTDLPEEPKVDMYFRKKIPIFHLDKIVGTVIGKDANKSLVYLLTANGVVTVKFTKEYFAMYNKKLSQKREDGTKKTLETSWFTRGIKLMITGFRRGDMFVAKTYKNTASKQIYKITKLYPNGIVELVHERAKADNVEEEEDA